jgi:hypothetical protein
MASQDEMNAAVAELAALPSDASSELRDGVLAKLTGFHDEQLEAIRLLEQEVADIGQEVDELRTRQADIRVELDAALAQLAEFNDAWSVASGIEPQALGFILGQEGS